MGARFFGDFDLVLVVVDYVLVYVEHGVLVFEFFDEVL